MGASIGFDAKNKKKYFFAIFFLFLAELLVVVCTLVGTPPGFSVDHERIMLLFLIAAIWAAFPLYGMSKYSVRPIYWVCSAAIVFSVAAFFSGFPWKLCALVGGSGFVVMTACFLLGDKGDVDTPERTVIIKIPRW